MRASEPPKRRMADSSESTIEIELPAPEVAAPADDRLRLVLLGVLGYGVLASVLVLAVAVVVALGVVLIQLHAGVLVLKLAWLPLVVAGVVLRALWVTIPEPPGIELDPQRFPSLFEALEGIRFQLRAPPIHRVVLTREMNAGVAQVPRLGILGRPRNTLSLGLPLMLVLRPESFRAVVGHELGHLSGNHGAFGSWLYRIGRTWQRVLEGLTERNAKLDFGLRRFFRWYVPYFEAHAFRLLRAHEYVADDCAAEVTSVRQACDTLVEVELLTEFASNHLRELTADLVRRDPDPPHLLRLTRRSLWDGPSAEAGHRALGEALRREASPNDTHPPLAARLAALDRRLATEIIWPTPGWASRSEGSAAEKFLGTELEGLIARSDAEWCEEVRLKWAGQHRQFQERYRKLEALERAALERELTGDEARTRVQETLELRDAEAALQVIRPYALAHPEAPHVRFALGRLLLERQDGSGIAEIEAAMAIDPRAIPPGCELIDRYLRARRSEEDLAAWRERARAFQDRIAERTVLEDDDELLPHDLDEETQGRLRRLFVRLPLQAVMLARKKVEYFPDYPVWVLGYSVRTRSGPQDRRALEDAVGQHLRQALSEVGDLIVFPLERRPNMIDILGALESSIVYDE
jgi:Zn-dependent protease with chaperone function